MTTNHAKYSEPAGSIPSSGADAKWRERAAIPPSPAMRQRLERVADLAEATFEISAETRALILDQIALVLQPARAPDERPSSRDDRAPDNQSPTTEPPAVPGSAAERLEHLQRNLANIRRTFEALADLDQTARKNLMNGEA